MPAPSSAVAVVAAMGELLELAARGGEGRGGGHAAPAYRGVRCCCCLGGVFMDPTFSIVGGGSGGGDGG